MTRIALTVCLAMPALLSAQLQPQSILTVTVPIGSSAISINTLVAKSYKTLYPVSEFAADTANELLIYTAKQTDGNASQYLGKGYLAAISAKDDKVKWINETSLNHLELTPSSVLLSNDVRTVRYKKSLGYEEIRYDSKIVRSWPGQNRGFMYDRDADRELSCVDLVTGFRHWSAPVPGTEDWVDFRPQGDSVVLIAAGGIHALHVKKGLLWSVPMLTSARTNKPLIYSPAKYQSLNKVANVLHTSKQEDLVTQIASNILVHQNRVYFAGREKLVALDQNGKQLWQLDLKTFPVSKMMLYATDSSLVLANFGLASHSRNMVAWGKPFIITIDMQNGSIINAHNLEDIENLADFVVRRGSFIFAGKNSILEAIPGKKELNTVIDIAALKVGRFTEFVDGDVHYILVEGHYVPLNFINDNLVYFKTESNKVYGIEGENLLYEYHYTELFRFDKKYRDNTLLVNDEKTIMTSVNFELLATFDTNDPSVLIRDRLYFISGPRLQMVRLDQLK